MRTRFRTVSAGSLAVLLGLTLAVSACGKYSWSALSAKKNIKEAHELCRDGSVFEGAGEQTDERRA